MNSPIARFSIRLLLVLLATFIIHLLLLYVLDLPLFENRIVLSYIFNFVLAISVFGLLYKFRKRFSHQLGFLFLASSGLKFLLFFILFYPHFMADDHITKLEFASFFVPYAISMILEITALSKLFNSMS